MDCRNVQTENVTSPFTCNHWTIKDILGLAESRNHIQPVLRVSAQQSSPEELDQVILAHEELGIPLIITNLHRTDLWKEEILSPEWVARECGDEGE